MVDKDPDSDVELPLVDEERLFNVFLDDETIEFVDVVLGLLLLSHFLLLLFRGLL
jgi:hypothetical protein